MTSVTPSALPPEQSALLHKAIRLEWISLVVMGVIIAAVGMVAGQSQAMRTAFVEDSLALLPPIAFLIGVRRAARPRSPEHPYGHHRAIAAGHLVSAVALLTFGLSLLYNGASGLVTGARPPVGAVMLLGQTLWSGWLMIVVMTLSAIPPVILGRMKLKLAEKLHDKVLAADADMLKADWQTGLATVAGVVGIGFGLWWADSLAAVLVSTSIVKDGVTNLRGAVAALLDARATPIESQDPHPVIAKLREAALRTDWVAEAAVRTRDMGHVFHSEVFVVPVEGASLSVGRVEELRQRCCDVDWKAIDTVVVVTDEIPHGLSALDRTPS
ncbi:cation diffusion facilitator family transporter [Tessaracoccus sp. Z1128]